MGNSVSIGDSVPATEFVALSCDAVEDCKDSPSCSLGCKNGAVTRSMFALPTSRVLADQRKLAGSVNNLSAKAITPKRFHRVNIAASVLQKQRKFDEKERLFTAAARGDAETVAELLDQGMDVNSCDADHLTALHYAAMHARPNAIQVLLERGADPNACDTKGGFTPLHWTVITSHSCITDLERVDKTILALAKGCCEVNRGDFNKATPLHFAARTDKRAIVETLMRLGADPNVKDIQGLSAAKVAKSRETKILIIKLADKRARAVYHVLHIPED